MCHSNKLLSILGIPAALDIDHCLGISQLLDIIDQLFRPIEIFVLVFLVYNICSGYGYVRALVYYFI